MYEFCQLLLCIFLGGGGGGQDINDFVSTVQFQTQNCGLYKITGQYCNFIHTYMYVPVVDTEL